MDHPTPEQLDTPDDEISLLDLLHTIADNLRLLVLGPLAVGLTALGVSFAIAPTYSASTVFLPPQQQQSAASSLLSSLGGLAGLAGSAAGIKNPNDQFLAYMKSRRVQDALIQRFSLMDRYEARLPEDARKALDAASRLTSGKDGLITVEVDDRDPQVAADIANAYVDELSKLLDRLSVTEAQQRRVFFEKQLQETQVKLTAADLALRASGIDPSVLKTQPQAAVGALAEVQAQIAAQEVKIASMRGYLTEQAPDFKQALTELRALRAQLSKVEQSSTVVGPASNDAGYVTRYRDFKYYETLFELFAKQFEIAKIDEAREGAVIQVLDVAIPPDYKSKPKKALIAVLATLASGFVLLLWVFLRQALRNAAAQDESAEKMSQIRQSLRRAIGLR